MSLYILDSDHLSLQQRGHPEILKRLLITPPDDIAITVITAEELIRGRLAQVRKAKQADKRVSAYRWLINAFELVCQLQVLQFDADAEKQFQLWRSNKIRIGTQDLRIAAIAFTRNATVVTRNRRDFQQVPNLRIEDWTV